MLSNAPLSPFQAVTTVDFPTLTLCSPANLDTGEYVRAMLNNLNYDDAMRNAFEGFIKSQVANETKIFLQEFVT